MAPAADQPPRGLRLGGRPVGESDAALLSRVAERDLEALDILYHRYARAVYGLALRRLGDRDGAEDATRRTFEAIWGLAATRVSESGDGARWLFTVAEKAIGDQASDRSHSVSRDEASEVESQPGPESGVEDGWPAFRVHAAVTGLPEQERVPLELVYWEERSQSEIAERLGLPLGTVKTRTLSALVQLATRLERLP